MSSSSLLSLDRWQAAGLIDSTTAQRIREWEASQPQTPARRWPAILALSFGAVLLSAGLLLFVSAHWDHLAPMQRFTLVLSTLAALHGAGAIFENRAPALSMTLHAIGTLALGGAIALSGQIFHLQEHWPGGIMLWGFGAAIGWAVLRQWPQAALTAILIPSWLASECFAFHIFFRMRETAPAFAGLCALAWIYLAARKDANDNATRKALGWIGAICILPLAVLAGADHWAYGAETRDIVAWTLAVAIPLGVGFLLTRGAPTRMAICAAAVAWTMLLNVIAANGVQPLLYIWYAIGAAGLAWWGVQEARPERINLGLAGFALTVLFFYFSSVMDKLGRSASLIALGLLFLGGGWALEQTRRRLMSNLQGGLA